MLKTFIKDLLTGIDGESFDISRVVMSLNAIALFPILVIGVGFYLYGWIIAKPFDIQLYFTSILTYEGGVGTLLTTGAASIWMKQKTEPVPEAKQP